MHETKLSTHMAESIHIIQYCASEVERQHDSPEYVYHMCNAWIYAVDKYDMREWITECDIKELGALVKPKFNAHRYRMCDVRVGMHHCPSYRQVPTLMMKWVEKYGMHANKVITEVCNIAYKEFEEIHPFEDGNGRVGKILFNWLNGTLHQPIMPKNWWGSSNP